MVIFIDMNVDELINNYFKLSIEEKEDLLCVLIRDYFRRNLDNGYTVVEIIQGVDDIINYASSREDYEMSQAFKDIKEAMAIAIKEMNLDV
jgi:hypothetical protein